MKMRKSNSVSLLPGALPTAQTIWSIPLHGFGGELLLYFLHRHAVGVHVVLTVIIVLMV